MAVEIVGEPQVEAGMNQAILRWKTNGVSGSRVRYGTSQEKQQWQTRSEEGVTDTHEVLLDGLNPATTYYFTVGTARRVLKEGAFTTTPDKNAGTSSVAQKPAAPRAPPAVAKGQSSPSSTPASKPKLVIPPLRKIWGDIDSLQDHYERHGPDFSSRSAEEYAQQAWLFLQRAIDEELPAKLDDEDGTVRIYDPKTKAFAAYRRDGRARTYFKPNSASYFDRQPGKLVRLKRAAR